MRASVGHILATPGGRDFILGLRDECSAVAKAAGHAPREAFSTRMTGMLTTEGSPLTASMYRDIKAGAAVEADHIVGDMIARGDAAKVPLPRLRTAYTHLKAYENQRI
jgi:2-dehydropantoate 2-reductase